MGNRIVISLEEGMARVIYASFLPGRGTHIGNKGGNIIKDALLLTDEELGDFLKRERTKEFIVVSHFSEFYQDIIEIPSVRGRYLRRVLEAEIRKRSTLRDFSYVYRVYGEKVMEKRKVKEVFVYAVEGDGLRAITNRFLKYGKRIKAIYPSVLSLSGIIDSEDSSRLCVMEAGLNKALFLLCNGKIRFIRMVQSIDKGLNDLDIHNINMTINYSRQALKINPTEVVLTGRLCRDYNADIKGVLPMLCCLPSQGVKAQGEVIPDFILPLSALFASSDIDILPGEYRGFRLTERLLKYSAASFLFLSLLGGAYVWKTANDIADMDRRLKALKGSMPQIQEAIDSYKVKRGELEEIRPLISFIKETTSVPDLKVFFYSLSNLYIKGIYIRTIDVSAGDGLLDLKIEGEVKGDSFSGLQSGYQGFLDSIKGIEGMAIKREGLNFKDRIFKVEAEYK